MDVLSRTAGDHGDRLGVDCHGGRKKAARQQTRLPLVLGVPAISSRISPTTVNIRVYAAYAPVLILVRTCNTSMHV